MEQLLLQVQAQIPPDGRRQGAYLRKQFENQLGASPAEGGNAKIGDINHHSCMDMHLYASVI